MERNRIIEKVTEPIEWVNSIMMMKKKNRIVRLCIDPVDLYKCIKCPNYPIPTLKDITAKLHGVKLFSKMDSQSGYWSLVLPETTSEVTTYSTVFGCYQFLRMPFGLLSVQDEVQHHIEEAFKVLEGLAMIIDDILVYGANQEEHDERLKVFIERALEKV
ncbi:hypothetical protein QYM36_011582 [Artemia franciscana]|uniref:Reverse transcriptase domain-containing protein n=1 Tax=Artemia franciscana TaxID=6661 RepID=A0AA88L1G1_ARTSF|nr:hypothetical protein QYM36_011582 [Artemia franciscana]